MKTTTFALVFLMFAVARAQTTQTDLTHAIGVKAGYNLGFLNGEDADLEGTESSARNNIRAGLFAEMVIHPVISLQLELDYSREGETIEGEGIAGTDWDIDLSYLQIPLLAKLYFPLEFPLRPFVYAGPFLGINLTADVDDIDEVEAFGFAENADLAERASNVLGGIVVGAGVRHDLEKFMWMLDVRLTQGLTKAFDDEVFDQVFAGTFSISVGVGMRY